MNKEEIKEIEKEIEKFMGYHPIVDFLLKNGEVIIYNKYRYFFTDYSHLYLIAKYKNNFYRIVHDTSVSPTPYILETISKEEVQKILSNHYLAWEEARKLGWWKEDLFEYFGIKKEDKNEQNLSNNR
jgi:hypothetical protein